MSILTVYCTVKGTEDSRRPKQEIFQKGLNFFRNAGPWPTQGRSFSGPWLSRSVSCERIFLLEHCETPHSPLPGGPSPLVRRSAVFSALQWPENGASGDGFVAQCITPQFSRRIRQCFIYSPSQFSGRWSLCSPHPTLWLSLLRAHRRISISIYVSFFVEYSICIQWYTWINFINHWSYFFVYLCIEGVTKLEAVFSEI